ncbi:hypothetical protein PanWU01x14_192300 [Parasponia andersonii]|uniref:Uncharacterized protein n=1 Tax=Parasponia andersonii TaxID=3476 RepID=A0A2P5C1G3_PARAD|nr:hypothetical protein PanWU01x14_192300 [Parasponia andersonii]
MYSPYTKIERHGQNSCFENYGGLDDWSEFFLVQGFNPQVPHSFPYASSDDIPTTDFGIEPIEAEKINGLVGDCYNS